MTTAVSIAWPRKYEILGVQVSATNYTEATRCIIESARQGRASIVSLHAVHAVVTTGSDPELRCMVNTFDLIGPDGQPVRWALNLLHRVGLSQRVYGPELMLRLCIQASEEGLPIFLYGGTPEVLSSLSDRLMEKFPKLRIAGSYAPPFRPLTEQEDREVVEAIRASGARLVFIGLGAPKQDCFAYEHRDRIDAVQVCVGAAFDFHAGIKKMAPGWMQRSGLEWLFRLVQEPRRLWRRYAVTNTVFVCKVGKAWLFRTAARRRCG